MHRSTEKPGTCKRSHRRWKAIAEELGSSRIVHIDVPVADVQALPGVHESESFWPSLCTFLAMPRSCCQRAGRHPGSLNDSTFDVELGPVVSRVLSYLVVDQQSSFPLGETGSVCSQGNQETRGSRHLSHQPSQLDIPCIRVPGKPVDCRLFDSLGQDILTRLTRGPAESALKQMLGP